MGCDGGTINASRADLVKLKKGPERIERESVNAMRWTLCGLSQEPLNPKDPVVCDALGNLFNKSAVIEHLLSKAHVPKYAHLKALKDVWSVRLTYPDDSKNQKSASKAGSGAAAAAAGGGGGGSSSAAAAAAAAKPTEVGAPKPKPVQTGKDASHMTGTERAVSGTGGRTFICPITYTPANGRYPFIVKRVCGCVYSKKAVTEVPSATCLLCGRTLPVDLKEREAENVPLLTDSMPELDRLRALMNEQRALTAAAAAAKKKLKAAATTATAPAADSSSSSSAAASSASASAAGIAAPNTDSKSASAATAAAGTAAAAANGSAVAKPNDPGTVASAPTKKRKADGAPDTSTPAADTATAAVSNGANGANGANGTHKPKPKTSAKDLDTAKKLKSLHPAMAASTVSAAADANSAVAANMASAAYRSIFLSADKLKEKRKQNDFISTKGSQMAATGAGGGNGSSGSAGLPNAAAAIAAAAAAAASGGGKTAEGVVPTAAGMANYEKYRSFRDTLYGKVRYGKHIRSGTIVVIKEYMKGRVEKKVMEDGTPIAEDAKEEIRLHQLISRQRHPHVVQMYDVQQDKEKIYTILEYCGKGEFFAYVQNEKFTNEVAQHYFRQLMQGVHYLHSRNVCHRDLSLENLLMDEKQVLKICDFGVAVEVKDGVRLSCSDPERRPGKIRYMAPEVFAASEYDPRSIDVWSCGVILFVMLVGAFPFEMPAPSDDRFQYIFKGHIADLLKLWGRQIPVEALDILARIFVPASKRITVAQILAHPFITKKIAASAPATATATAATAGAAAANPTAAPATATAAAAATNNSAAAATATATAATVHTPNSTAAASMVMSPGFGVATPSTPATPPIGAGGGVHALAVNVNASAATATTATGVTVATVAPAPSPTTTLTPQQIAALQQQQQAAYMYQMQLQQQRMLQQQQAAAAAAKQQPTATAAATSGVAFGGTAAGGFISNNATAPNAGYVVHGPGHTNAAVAAAAAAAAVAASPATATAAPASAASAALLALQQQTLAAIAHAQANHLSITLTAAQLASLTPAQIAALKQKQSELTALHNAQRAQQKAAAAALAASNTHSQFPPPANAKK